MKKVRQEPGDRFRRWFCDETVDLVVWYEPDGSIYGFQICYDPQNQPRALTWTPPHGFRHADVDLGADEGYANRTPMLRPGGRYDAARLRVAFRAAAGGLPPAEKAFVEGRLAESSG